MTNVELRTYAMSKGVKQWQIAEKLGVSESVLCRKLRHELSEDDKSKIYQAIDQAEKGVVNG